MSLLGKANFVPMATPYLEIVLCHSEWHVDCHSPTHLFSSVLFSFSGLHQLEQLNHLQQNPAPLQFPLPDVVIARDVTPTHWAFYFQGFWLTLSVHGSW